MNKAILTDIRVSVKPEVKVSSSGKNYASILAGSYVGKDQQGNSKYVNLRITVFGKTAERSVELDKGSIINVVGNITDVSHYTRNDGKISTTLEINADSYEKPLSERPRAQQGTSTAPQQNSPQNAPASAPKPAANAYDAPNPEDDLPF